MQIQKSIESSVLQAFNLIFAEVQFSQACQAVKVFSRNFFDGTSVRLVKLDIRKLFRNFVRKVESFFVLVHPHCLDSLISFSYDCVGRVDFSFRENTRFISKHSEALAIDFVFTNRAIDNYKCHYGNAQR